MQCRVKTGKQLPHGGAVLESGADVELTPAIAHEVRHLVDEVLPTGEVRPIGTGERAAAELEAALASARPHERISILEAARGQVAGDLAKIDAAIAAERKRIEGETKAAEKAIEKNKKAAETN